MAHVSLIYLLRSYADAVLVLHLQTPLQVRVGLTGWDPQLHRALHIQGPAPANHKGTRDCSDLFGRTTSLTRPLEHVKGYIVGDNAARLSASDTV